MKINHQSKVLIFQFFFFFSQRRCILNCRTVEAIATARALEFSLEVDVILTILKGDSKIVINSQKTRLA